MKTVFSSFISPCCMLSPVLFHSNAVACISNHGCHCFDRAFPSAGACVCCVKISCNKRKRQPIGMLGRSSGNHDWLLANASACVSCSFRLRNARNASDWMETGLHSYANDIVVVLSAASERADGVDGWLITWLFSPFSGLKTPEFETLYAKSMW